VATALDLVERGMDFADALHLGKAAHCDGMASFDRKFVKAAKAAGYDNVREARGRSSESTAGRGERIENIRADRVSLQRSKLNGLNRPGIIRKRNPSEAFDELDKLIFCKIWDERTPRKAGEPYDFQVFTDDKGDDLKKRIQALYQKGREKDPEVFKEDIRLSNSELQTVVGYLAGTNLGKTDLDSKGRAFETFMTGFFRGDFGQYFTPRNIVKFIVDALPINHESVVIDTSCGSGGFLLHALDKVRREADRMAEEGYFGKGSHQHRDHWYDFAENNLYGIEISEGIARTSNSGFILKVSGK